MSQKAHAIKAFILCPLIKAPTSYIVRSKGARLEEAEGLALAIHLDVAGKQVVNLNKISPSTYIGSGLTDELHGLFQSLEIEVVIFDCALSPVQQRNLERKWKVKIVDRTGLILEIFADRARTAEGRLQVELATLQYRRGRLVRAWSHLERQRGGFGFTGGPGESQIELDRRMIDERITKIKKELEQTVRTRRLQRSARERVPYPLVALVGYTNAGKSTLFNTLTQADVFAKDLLFATLDPTMRTLKLPSGQEIILSDTVGFISDLPTSLIAAFRATLEEVTSADVIIHVRDINHEDSEFQRQDVETVLGELGLDTAKDDERIIEVWNKLDLLDEEMRAITHNKLALKRDCIAISALSGEGLHELKKLIDDKLTEDHKAFDVTLPLAAGDLLAWCYRFGAVHGREDDDTGIHLNLRLPKHLLPKFWERYRKVKST